MKIVKVPHDASAEVRAWARDLGSRAGFGRDARRCTTEPSVEKRHALRSHGDRSRSPHVHGQYWVVLWHDDTCFSYSRRVKLGTFHAKKIRLSAPTLPTILAWLARAEKTFGVSFRRDRAYVTCMAKGGKRAIESWLRAT